MAAFSEVLINRSKKRGGEAPHLKCEKSWYRIEWGTIVRGLAIRVGSELGGAAAGNTEKKLHCRPTQATEHQRPEQHREGEQGEKATHPSPAVYFLPGTAGQKVTGLQSDMLFRPEGQESGSAQLRVRSKG